MNIPRLICAGYISTRVTLDEQSVYYAAGGEGSLSYLIVILILSPKLKLGLNFVMNTTDESA